MISKNNNNPCFLFTDHESVHFGEKICQKETRACWFFKSPDGKVINADSI